MRGNLLLGSWEVRESNWKLEAVALPRPRNRVRVLFQVDDSWDLKENGRVGRHFT